ncbi:hypothetical protein [Paenibacillus puerhi]|uniref:hypothetical protein n=1 Tax=Paenibacillus puerhi TaxID=2692622 RepID=UPI001359E757|nr:hypothetical protein [Paenibacillus puerhi]
MRRSKELQYLIQDRLDNALAQVEQQEDIVRLRAMERASYTAMKHSICREELHQFIAWEEIYWILHIAELKWMYQQGLRDGMNEGQGGRILHDELLDYCPLKLRQQSPIPGQLG